MFMAYIFLLMKKNMLKKDFTNKGKKEIVDYHISVMKQVSRLESALTEMDFHKADKILKKEGKYQIVVRIIDGRGEVSGRMVAATRRRLKEMGKA